MNKYIELITRQKAELADSPLHFASSEEEFNQLLEELHLTHEEAKKQLMFVGHDAFIRNEDLPAFSALMQKQQREIAAEIAADTDGEGFLLDLLVAELENSHYTETGDPSAALQALNMNEYDLSGNPRVYHALELAMRRVCGNEDAYDDN